MSDQEENQATEEQTDNLVDVLDDFNSEESVPTDEATGSSDDVVEDKGEGEEGTTEQREEAIQWLIDNKFKDNDKGKADLATAYRELQSKTDKERTESTNKAAQYEQLNKLDAYLRENPDVVQNLQSRISSDANDPPEKPEDYDILDEQIDGSSSATWRDEHDSYLIRKGSQSAKDEIGKFKQEIQMKQQHEAEVSELKDLGLDDGDIESFNSFMNNNDNLTNKNLVKIWKFLSPQNNEKTPTSKGKTKHTTAVASPGKAPVSDTDPETGEVDKFWNGIMDNSRKV